MRCRPSHPRPHHLGLLEQAPAALPSRGTGRSRRAGGRRSRSAIAVAGLLGGGSLLLSACGGTAADFTAGQPANPLMTVYAKSHTVDLYLRAADPNGSTQFNFDGASAGHMTISVPAGWTVDGTCHNESTILTHSCAIVAQGTTTLAFPGSAVPHPVTGIKPGSAETFSFVASRPGSYQLVCLVPGHRDAGMWDHFVVTSGGQPTITGA